MRRVLVLLTLAAVAAFFTPVAGAQTPGTTLTFTNEAFRCVNQSLTDFGPLPLKIVLSYPNPGSRPDNYWVQNGGALFQNCTAGDGVATPGDIDVIVEQAGDGHTHGVPHDALVVKHNSHDITFTGQLNCGPGAPDTHQDGWNIWGSGPGIYGVDLEIGDWETQTPTCHGAGGLAYLDHSDFRFPDAKYSAGLVDALCIRCKVVASKIGPHDDPNTGQFGKGLFIGHSTLSGSRDSCYSAVIPMEINPFNPDAVPAPEGADRPISEGNFLIDRGGPAPPMPGATYITDPADCPLPDDPPPPPPPPLAECEDGLDNDADDLVDMADPGCASASDDDEFNEPPPPPPPPPCDEACVADLRAQVLSLTTQLDACKGKLRNISAFFHHRPKDIFRAYKMHAKVHETSPCSDRWHG